MGNMSGFGNANDVPDESFSPVPAGWVNALAIPGDSEKTKHGLIYTEKGGQMIRLQFQIVDGEFKNRKVLQFFTYTNSNEQAQRIGRGQLAKFCRSIGVPSPQDTNDLLWKKVRIKLEVDGDYNRIKDFAPYQAGPGQAGGTMVQPQQQQSDAPNTTSVAEGADPFGNRQPSVNDTGF